MNLHDILSHEKLELPIIQNRASDFLETITVALNDFIQVVNQLDEEDINFEYGNDIHVQQPHAIKSILNLFRIGLLDTINIYLNGRPAAAFDHFKSIMEEFSSEHLKIKQFAKNEDFYRIRINTSNYLYPSKEMFHIPFEQRGIISTQRYSIPGFPSLYLGRTIYGCWEEMRRPSINDFQAVRLENTEVIKYLDLVPCIPAITDILNAEHYLYLMTWPLIACCSVKVKNDKDYFKPEYIIPQLLLQWVREKEVVDGIRYNSTHAQMQYRNNSGGDFSNLVIPVKKIHVNGHCTELQRMFKMTEPVSWQTKQFASGGANFVYSRQDDIPLDAKIPKLEIIKGMIYPYSYSEIGHLERYLGYMKAFDL